MKRHLDMAQQKIDEEPRSAKVWADLRLQRTYMSHNANLLHLLGRLKNEIGDSDEYDGDEPEELRHRPSRWSRSPEPAGEDRSEWSESPERAKAPTFTSIGAPDIDVELMQLLEQQFPREKVPEMVRIRWSLRTVYDLYKLWRTRFRKWNG
jgi:hypothetical protein